MHEPLERRIAAIAALDQPIRRDLHRLMSERGRAISRDEAADALGVGRSVAAFHLDKMVEAGLADVTFERLSGRTGPGAGRPSKLYRRAANETSVSVPERHYDLAGSLLATAVEEAARTGAPVQECLSAAARAAGHVLGGEATAAVAGRRTSRARRREAVLAVLDRHGYEPKAKRSGEVALANCPFHRLAEQHRELVCGMNLDFLSGLLEGLGERDGLSARLAPEPGWCCVRIDVT